MMILHPVARVSLGFHNDSASADAASAPRCVCGAFIDHAGG